MYLYKRGVKGKFRKGGAGRARKRQSIDNTGGFVTPPSSGINGASDLFQGHEKKMKLKKDKKKGPLRAD